MLAPLFAGAKRESMIASNQAPEIEEKGGGCANQAVTVALLRRDAYGARASSTRSRKLQGTHRGSGLNDPVQRTVAMAFSGPWPFAFHFPMILKEARTSMFSAAFDRS